MPNFSTRPRRVKLEAVTGRRISVSIPNDDYLNDPEDLTGYTAFAKIIDESGTVIQTLSPTTGGTGGTFILNEIITADLTPGSYRWKGGLIVSGQEDLRYEGPFLIRKKIEP